MDNELEFWTSITRHLPRVRGSGRLSSMVARIYNRRKRPNVVMNVLGFKMALDPADCIDRELVFCPQIIDRKELACLKYHLNPSDVFVDAGANVGLYSLVASRIVGKCGTVLAIEADPTNTARLMANLQLSGVTNVKVANVGLSDKCETLRLGLDDGRNKGGHSFLYQGEHGVDVPCRPLADVLTEAGLTRVDGMKMDIEGFEQKVLQAFFVEENKSFWPLFIIIEVWQGHSEALLGLLTQHGYKVSRISEINYLATRY